MIGRKFEVIESKVWFNKTTGATASIYGAFPGGAKSDWEIASRGWTVQNPYTGEVGACRVPFKTEAEAEAFAATHVPSSFSYGA